MFTNGHIRKTVFSLSMKALWCLVDFFISVWGHTCRWASFPLFGALNSYWFQMPNSTNWTQVVPSQEKWDQAKGHKILETPSGTPQEVRTAHPESHVRPPAEVTVSRCEGLSRVSVQDTRVLPGGIEDGDTMQGQLTVLFPLPLYVHCQRASRSQCWRTRFPSDWAQALFGSKGILSAPVDGQSHWVQLPEQTRRPTVLHLSLITPCH